MITIIFGILLIAITGIALYVIITPREYRPQKVVLRSKICRELDISKVPGTIYYLNTTGNLMSFRPSSDEIETLLVIDSMDIKAISPDGMSVLLIYPKGYDFIFPSRDDKQKFSNRKFFWMTLDDGRMRLITEKKIQYNDYYIAGFNADGSKIYFTIITHTDTIRTMIADTCGNLTLLPENIWRKDLSGNFFIGRRNSREPWILFNLNNEKPVILDTILFPKESCPRLWFNDSIIVQICKDENSYDRIIFLNIKKEKVDTVNFGWCEYNLLNHPKLRIIARERSSVLHLLSKKTYDRVFVYDRNSLLWETYGPNIWYGIFTISPDGKNFLTRDKGYGTKNDSFFLNGPNGTRKKIPLFWDMRYLGFLGWFND